MSLSDEEIERIADAQPCEFIWREGNSSECGVLLQEAIAFARAIERAATIAAMRRCADIVTAEMIGFADDDAQLLRARSEIRAEIAKLEAEK